MNEILFTVIGVLISVIGYFLKLVHQDVKKAIEDVGNVKGQLDVMNAEQVLKFQRMEETTQLKIDQLTSEITRLIKAMDRANK